MNKCILIANATICVVSEYENTCEFVTLKPQ